MKKSTFVHESALVEDQVELGEGVQVWMGCQLRRGAKVGGKTILGKGAYLDLDVIVGEGCKIQNHATLYKGVIVEDDVFIGPHVCFTNDLFPRAFNADWKIVKTRVKSGASIGANATIICGVELGEYCMVGAGSVVTKDVEPHALVVGNPAKQIGWVSIAGEVLDSSLRCPSEGRQYMIDSKGFLHAEGSIELKDE